MDAMLLSQYQNSPNLREHLMCYVSELDLLFEEMQNVYYGRFLANAVGAQLDVIGIILQQHRSIILGEEYFGFNGAPGATKMADGANPNDGGVFFSADNAGLEVTPLTDTMYRRVLEVIAFLTNKDSLDINTVYKVVTMILNRVPAVMGLDTHSGLGSELAFAASVDSQPVGGSAEKYGFWAGGVQTGKTYRLYTEITNYVGSGYVGFRPHGFYGITGAESRNSNGIITADIFVSSQGTGLVETFTRNANACTFSNNSLKEIVVDNRRVNLTLAASDTTSAERALIQYMSKYFIPSGLTFAIELI